MSEEKLFSAVEMSIKYDVSYNIVLDNISKKRLKAKFNGGSSSRKGQPKYLISESDFIKWFEMYKMFKGIENENK